MKKSKPKLKIGDTVTIRKDLELKTYGLNTVVPDMLQYVGQEAVVMELLKTKPNNCKLNIDDRRWCWDIDMFESVESVKDVDIFKEECETESHEYQEGDKVKVREDLVPGNYGEIDFVQPMSQYLGKHATIEEIDSEGDFTLDVDGGKYFWSKEMVIPVGKEESIDYKDEYIRLSNAVNEYEDTIDELEEELKEVGLDHLVLIEKYNSLVQEYNNLIDLYTQALIENVKSKKKTTI